MNQRRKGPCQICGSDKQIEAKRTCRSCYGKKRRKEIISGQKTTRPYIRKEQQPEYIFSEKQITEMKILVIKFKRGYDPGLTGFRLLHLFLFWKPEDRRIHKNFLKPIDVLNIIVKDFEEHLSKKIFKQKDNFQYIERYNSHIK